MNERLVVSFRSPELFVEPAAYLSAARSLCERAAALGGELVSWGATVFAFEFEPEAREDTIELVLAVVTDASSKIGVGISEGSLESVAVRGGRVLKWGTALVHATALARAARPGEVLVDPSLRAVRRGELLTTGARVGVYGRLRLRGLLLDLRYPFCEVLAERARSLVRPEHIGSAALDSIAIEPGCVAIVRAERGAGGSRALDEIERRNAEAPLLRVTPHSFGEPLGGLRRAVRSASARGLAKSAGPASYAESLEAFVSGEGLDADSCAELVVAILSPDPHDDVVGLVTVDDAGEVDADSLEVLARALEIRPDAFGVVLRLGETDRVPSALFSAPRGSELELRPLPVEHAAEVAQACLKGELDDRSATRWGSRGGRLPLGVVEAVRDAIETGEIAWEQGRASARLRSSGTGEARGAKHWIRRRLERLDTPARRVLEALTVLGGEAEEAHLRAVVKKRDDLLIEVTASLQVLEARAFIVRSDPDFVALPSATHRDTILATFSESDYRAWHQAACAESAESERTLAASMATIHAVLAGDLQRAQELSRKAAATTRAVGLETTAAAFDDFATTGNLESLSARNLFSAQLEAAKAAAGAPPPKDAEEPSAEIREETAFSPSVAVEDDSGDEEELEIDVEVEPALSTANGPGGAVKALRTGDVHTVERLAEELREKDGSEALAERLSAMAKLARGETGDAIRRLRDAAEAARSAKSKERCRTALALGVALASSGRHEDALFEALEALARARESSDRKGEQACLRFLAQLSVTAGHPTEAAAWARLIEA